MVYAENKRYFKNREDAGNQLGLFLKPKYASVDPLVIGIPRGGVEVAFYVARQLNADLSVIVSKKLPLPQQPEFGIGAVGEEDFIYISPQVMNIVSRELLNELIEEQKREVDRRVIKYRQGSPIPEMAGRTVILVDDGIATGVTLVPVVQLCRKKNAARIIIAVPVSGLSYNEHLNEADAIEVLIQPASFFAVGQVYEEFGNLDDADIVALLSKAGKEQDSLN